MLANIIQTILEDLGFAGIAMLIFGALFTRYLKKRDQRADEMAVSKREESILLHQSRDLMGDFIKSMRAAQKAGRLNGEVDLAERAFDEHCKAVDEYLLKQNANANH